MALCQQIAVCDRKTDKAEEWIELWEPKFIAQICKIQRYVLYDVCHTQALNSS